MNMKVWTILAAMISTSAFADQPALAPAADTNAAPVVTTGAAVPEVAPAPAGVPETAPAVAPAKPTKKKTAKKASTKAVAKKKATPAPELRTTPLIPGPAIVGANHVNVRGRAGLIGEVIGKLTNGQPVNVIEEVTLKNSKPDEPSAWAKINLPETVNVWVHAGFLNRSNLMVSAKRLNLRGGPGENYSVLGSLQKGDAVKELQTKGDWMEIEAPTNAYAFVAAQYLKQEAPAIVSAATVQPEEAPTNTTAVAEMPVVAPATEIPAEPAVVPTNEVAAVVPGTNAPEAMPAAEAPAVAEPLPPRIVAREGLVRSTVSIQAPTKFELVSQENFRPINYLFTTSTNVDLSRYKGMHIIVTGEEGLDERWKNTPVITIQSIRVIE
ncbi:MAG TPA: SH3 domain-containing protein [Candidatus Paceibacterota bacterium]|nr:SH3 domain-containing protein [Candidatus Paceibacterota bacterium]